MELSILLSLFYVISSAIFVMGVYCIKKTEKEYIAAVWIPVTFMILCCTQVLVAAVFSLVKIPVTLFTIGIVNLILGCLIWCKIYRVREIQKYKYEWIDLIALVVVVVLGCLFIATTCGWNFSPHYLAADAAVHMKMAMQVIHEQKVVDMFFSALHHAIFIEIFSPLVATAVSYKLFVLSDVLHLLFAWCMFYAVVRRYASDRYLKIAAIVAMVLYGCAYPMNSTLFGFTYLGIGIVVISYLLIVTDLFANDEIEKKAGIALVSLGCLGIFVSYVLFMPVVFFAILFVLLVKQAKAKQLFSLDTIKCGLAIFLIPTILGLLFTYIGIFSSEGTTVGGAIANEGGIYRDLYSNFLLLIPLALFAIYHALKNKRNKVSIILLVLLLGFMLVLFVLGMYGKVSSYYFYKNYYLLWLLVFELAFWGITYLEKNSRVLIATSFITWFLIFLAFLSNIENKINNQASLFCTTQKASAYNDIYSFNRDAMNLPFYSEGKIDLYCYVMKHLSNGEEIAIAGQWEDLYWMDGMTYQNFVDEYYYWNVGEEIYFETLNKRADYVVVLYDAPIYDNNVDFFESLEKVCENGTGFIAKINK